MKGLLIDLDGVLYVREQIIPGALEVLRFIGEKNVPHCFVTNTTSLNRRQLAGRLEQAGFAIQVEHVFTAPLATAAYLRSLRDPRCFFFASDNLRKDFLGIHLVEENPTHVVIGDMAEGFSYTNMNKLFRMVRNGAEMVAFQKNRYWLTPEGVVLDAGSFIAAIEYATGAAARVFGKPSKEFFIHACRSMNLDATNAIMIGDDYQVDILGAHRAGLETFFVRTGKDRERVFKDNEVRPTRVLGSIAELAQVLDEFL